MQLSAHFTLAELTRSQTAARNGIDNTPDDRAIAALKALAQNILEPVRNHFGKPFSPSSGFRCPQLNFKVGSSPSSQHITGQAADFEVPDVSNLELAEWIRDNLAFDQLILEFYEPGKPNAGWVHCSYTAIGENRFECLTINREGTAKGFVTEKGRAAPLDRNPLNKTAEE